MSQIQTNVSSLIAQRTLGNQNQSLNTSLERLSTGFKINRGSDDPSGLIASESLRSEQASIEAAIGNAERADQVVNIAEGGLQEVNSLLLEVQSLVGQSANDAGLSDEEKAANQLEVDSILQTIDRVASSTSFQGSKLLNGSFDYAVDNQDSKVADFKVNTAKLDHDDTREVDVNVTQSAQNAGLFLSAGGGAAALDLGQTADDNGSATSGSAANIDAADARFSFELAGAKGSREFSLTSGTTLSSVADQINTFTDVIGVSATTSGTAGSDLGLVLKSTEAGSDQFVSVNVTDAGGFTKDDDSGNEVTYFTSGGFTQLSATNANAAGSDFTAISGAPLVEDEGQDLGAVINGIAATTSGRSASISTDFLALEVTLTEGGSQALGNIDAFDITGGGAQFNLGPNVDINNQASIGIGNVASRHLGTTAQGFLDELGSGQDASVESGDLAKAQNIVNSAIDQVSGLRGRLGAFQKNTIGSTINSLGVALENTAAAESSIRDTDFAKETAQLSRSQILVQAATNTLGIANQQPQNALALLR